MPGILTQAVNMISDGLGRQLGQQRASTQSSTSTQTGQTASTGKIEQSKDIVQSDVLGKDDFFKLLITQLKYQDPLKPMENKEFIAQMAQFSSLEQMQNMNQQMGQFLQLQGLGEGVSLIGKTVTTIETDEVESITGKVTKVGFSEGDILVYLEDGKTVNIKDIETVYQ